MVHCALRTAVAVCAFGAAGLADPPPAYYLPAEGKTGKALRQALHEIVRNHTIIPYSSGTRFDTSDALRALDRDPANSDNIIGVYSRESEPTSSFGLTTGWNREHLWPDSYGLDGKEPAYSDLHNLRAEDVDVNSSRGNRYFDPSDSRSAGYQAPAHPEAPLASMDGDSWEPPAGVRGDIARAMFYMAIRYTGDVAGEPALSLTDSVEQIGGSTNLMGGLTTLLRWSAADPVDATELSRNDGIYSYQSNRNPFVDVPEWVIAAFVPALSVVAVGDGIAISWTNEAPAMVLERSHSLAPTWEAVTNAPTLTSSNTWAIGLTRQPASSFFRLRLP